MSGSWILNNPNYLGAPRLGREPRDLPNKKSIQIYSITTKYDNDLSTLASPVILQFSGCPKKGYLRAASRFLW